MLPSGLNRSTNALRLILPDTLPGVEIPDPIVGIALEEANLFSKGRCQVVYFFSSGPPFQHLLTRSNCCKAEWLPPHLSKDRAFASGKARGVHEFLRKSLGELRNMPGQVMAKAPRLNLPIAARSHGDRKTPFDIEEIYLTGL